MIREINVTPLIDAATGAAVWSDQAGPSPEDRWHGIHDINAGNGVLVVAAGADIVVYGDRTGSTGVSRPAADDPVLLDVVVSVPAPLSPAVGYQTNLAHTGEQAGLLGPAPRKLWTRAGLGARGVSYPVIAQGKVYFTSGALLYAIDATTGRVVGEAIPAQSGGGTVRHMTFDPRTRFIWFGTDNNTIGRIEVP